MILVRTSAAVAILFVSGCATALSPNRESYILAQPHGWIELTIVDQNVPAIPDGSGTSKAHRPETCAIQVTRDQEPFLDELLYPSGENAPYRISSGFRFPVPLGSSTLHIRYSGCRAADGKAADSDATVDVIVATDSVTSVGFDGRAAVAVTPREDTAITLEKIYRRLDGSK